MNPFADVKVRHQEPEEADEEEGSDQELDEAAVQRRGRHEGHLGVVVSGNSV